MGKTRDLFKNIRDIKGTFHANMGSIKDRNGRDLTEAEDIKRWQEYTEELYKKDLHDPWTRVYGILQARILEWAVNGRKHLQVLRLITDCYLEIAMRETWVESLGWEDPLEKGKVTHSSILAWRIP